MTDDGKSIEGRVTLVAARYLPILEAMGWEIDLHFSDLGDETLARAETRWPYMHANLIWNNAYDGPVSDDKLHRTFLHEIAHVLIAEMNKKGKLHEERVATQVATFISRLEKSRD